MPLAVLAGEGVVATATLHYPETHLQLSPGVIN